MSPRASSLLIDSALAMMLYIFWAAESWAGWPASLLSVHIMLFTKVPGGFRPTALLPPVSHVCTKVRISHGRAWAVRSARPYFPLEGKSTVDAGARTMIYSEDHQGSQSKAVPTTLIDISKCFDRVCWRRVLQAAARMDFPCALCPALPSD
eukprot:8540017-Pyramimonas_sp.AAC.1